MNGRVAKHAFATSPGDADTWVRMREAPISRESKASLFTARLTIDDTPGQCGRIKVTTLQRGQIVADMLRELRARGFSYKRRLAMNAIAAAGRRSNDAATASTRVELDWLGKRIKHWIRFGRIVKKRVLNRRWRIFSFPPRVVFTFVRWAPNDLRTIISRIDIVRAVALGEPYATLPFVRPGGDILLRTNGWPKVDPALQAIGAVEVCGVDPDDAAPDPWRYVHNRLTLGKQAVPKRSHATRLSHCAAVSRHDQPRRNSRGHGARRRLLGAPSTRQPPAAVRLECQRQRADRSLRRRHIIDVHAGDLFVVRPAEPPARFPAARG
jgi:hypothetical protein